MVSGWIEFIEEFDPTLFDLVFSFSDLTWRQLVVSVATIVAWRIAVAYAERLAALHARRAVAWGLFRLAMYIKP